MKNEQLAMNIKSLCSKKKITLGKLFDDLNIPRSFISDITTKNNSPSIERVKDIADYFQVSIDNLIGRTEETNAKNVTYGNNSTSGDNSVVNNNKTDELPYITLAIIEELKKIPEEEQADIFKELKIRKNKNVM
jgi:transcriptional regulator with XRE-family HTH domain